jgi:D-xylose transport system substrate-binding protein
MRLRILLLFGLTFPLLAGWGHWGSQVKIGFALGNGNGREALVKSLKEEMDDNRADLLLMDAKGDPAVQEKQVKKMIAQGIQTLIVLPADPLKAAPLVEAAHQAGIKVISLESMIPASGLDNMVAFNPEKEGELQAKAMVKRVPRGNYVLLGKGQEFREGQMKVLQPLIDKGDIHVVVSHTFHGTAPKENTVDAVLASDGEMVKEAAPATSLHPQGSLVGGTGEDLQTCRRIIAETQALTVYHSPKKLAEETAYLGAKLARKATQFDCQFTELDNGGSKTFAVLLTPMVVDAKNLDSTIIQDGVQKREEVYGK